MFAYHCFLAGVSFFALNSASATDLSNPDVCLGEYEICPETGNCVLDSSLCGVCTTAGEFLCPDGSTCVQNAFEVQFCPITVPLFNWTLPLAERVAGTISMMTLDEKAALIVMQSPGVIRLGIPKFNYWTEAQHGVGVKTMTPASSSPNTNTLASAWSPSLFARASAMTAIEARGRHNSAVHTGSRLDPQLSLTTFAPEMNVVRAPLWGRVQESCGGEDPLLNARHSASFVVGMQVGAVLYWLCWVEKGVGSSSPRCVIVRCQLEAPSLTTYCLRAFAGR